MTDIQIVIISACPDAWDVNLDLGKCYYYIDEGMTWSKANDMCAALDPDGVATLTSIRSQAENDYVFSFIDGSQFWIGGTDEDVEDEWR